MSTSTFAIIEAPSILGLFPKGVERLPDALLAAGLAEKLGARRAGRIEPPSYDDRRDPETQMLNPHGIAAYALALATATADVIDAGNIPVVLGGDCSIVLGPLLALKRQGRYGLLFLDGHADFYQPEAEPNGEAASMELALATGRGPAIVTDLGGQRPLLRDEDVVALGRRDADESDAAGSQRIEESGVHLIDFAAIRAQGIAPSIASALTHLTKPDLAGFWLHLDADVLDDTIMPAVDYRLPGGLSWADVSTVLAAAHASGRLAGVDITIFNPALDPSGAIAPQFAHTIAQGLTP